MPRRHYRYEVASFLAIAMGPGLIVGLIVGFLLDLSVVPTAFLALVLAFPTSLVLYHMVVPLMIHWQVDRRPREYRAEVWRLLQIAAPRNWFRATQRLTPRSSEAREILINLEADLECDIAEWRAQGVKPFTIWFRTLFQSFFGIGSTFAGRIVPWTDLMRPGKRKGPDAF